MNLGGIIGGMGLGSVLDLIRQRDRQNAPVAGDPNKGFQGIAGPIQGPPIAGPGPASPSFSGNKAMIDKSMAAVVGDGQKRMNPYMKTPARF